MVTTTRITNADRNLQVMVTTMDAARKYEKDWPKASLAILAMIRREFSAELVRLLSRSFEEMEETKPYSTRPDLRGQMGIIIHTHWSMSEILTGRYIICIKRIGREFVVINRDDGTIYSGDDCLVKVIGGPEYVGNMSLFIDACVYTIEELFRKRHEDLQALQGKCLLRPMYEAFDPLKYGDIKQLVSDLDRKP